MNPLDIGPPSTQIEWGPDALAATPEDHDMSSMKRLAVSLFAIAWLALAGGGADAQSPNNLVGGSIFNPPLPAPLPSPKIEAPAIPQMDAPPIGNYAPAPSTSFSDRITTCLDEAAASGLGPSDREEYSRSCANR